MPTDMQVLRKFIEDKFFPQFFVPECANAHTYSLPIAYRLYADCGVWCGISATQSAVTKFLRRHGMDERISEHTAVSHLGWPGVVVDPLARTDNRSSVHSNTHCFTRNVVINFPDGEMGESTVDVPAEAPAGDDTAEDTWLELEAMLTAKASETEHLNHVTLYFAKDPPDRVRHDHRWDADGKACGAELILKRVAAAATASSGALSPATFFCDALETKCRDRHGHISVPEAATGAQFVLYLLNRALHHEHTFAVTVVVADGPVATGVAQACCLQTADGELSSTWHDKAMDWDSAAFQAHYGCFEASKRKVGYSNNRRASYGCGLPALRYDDVFYADTTCSGGHCPIAAVFKVTVNEQKKHFGLVCSPNISGYTYSRRSVEAQHLNSSIEDMLRVRVIDMARRAVAFCAQTEAARANAAE